MHELSLISAVGTLNKKLLRIKKWSRRKLKVTWRSFGISLRFAIEDFSYKSFLWWKQSFEMSESSVMLIKQIFAH